MAILFEIQLLRRKEIIRLACIDAYEIYFWQGKVAKELVRIFL
jgi:hypothetical protein